MKIKKHAFKCVACLFMALMMVFGMVVATGAAEADVADTSVSGSVYFKNTAGWSTVNAYIWVSGTETSVQAWPGAAMTLVKDNVYRCDISGDYNMIIFSNNGGNQTKDLSIPAAGQIYDYSTGSWGPYTDDPNPPTPTVPGPTPPGPTPGDKVVYCKDSAGWGAVKVYMWSGTGTSNNGAWPGVSMQSIGDGVYQYNITGDWNKVIFNNGSTQTGDLDLPGSGYIYDNGTGEWSVYDTSPIRVTAYGTDIEGDIYKGSDVVLSSTATSTGGNVFYKFSVTANGSTTVLADFSAKNTCAWTPETAGTYTVTFDYKDDAGNENQRTAQITVKDDSSIEEPILKGISPKPGFVKKGTPISFTANAAGGKVGTNLLFYKFTVKDANGVVVNVPYYTKNTGHSFTPNLEGTFTVTVSVQNSNNAVIERTFTYTSSSNAPVEPTLPTPKPTTGDQSLRGDADKDGNVTIMDATMIQLYLAKTEVDINLENADADLNGDVNIMDATTIQLKLANITTW